MTPAIRVENLAKCYRINHAEERLPYKTLRDTLAQVATMPVRRWRSSGHVDLVEQFWALKDVSFVVQPGEVVGIIGRNGAGKSTLLKILSRITKPTSGYATLRGRVGSLLEVGTGFHQELTGRENIYLNGSILGMRRWEISRKFDEIVDFSGVEKFLDTPVKRYSSGMQVRLAFAVAAHLEPEIIVVDEVLAVGDMEFQRKCMGRMSQIGRSGCTVLFVSHNMSAIGALCTRTILLGGGQVIQDGESAEVAMRYLEEDACTAEVDLRNWKTGRSGTGQVRLLSLATLDHNGQLCSHFEYGEPISFEINVAGEVGTRFILGVRVNDVLGTRILHLVSTDDRVDFGLDSGVAKIRVSLPNVLLNDGTYYISLAVGDKLGSQLDEVGTCLQFKVVSHRSGVTRSRGCVRLPAAWSLS